MKKRECARKAREALTGILDSYIHSTVRNAIVQHLTDDGMAIADAVKIANEYEARVSVRVTLHRKENADA